MVAASCSSLSVGVEMWSCCCYEEVAAGPAWSSVAVYAQQAAIASLPGVEKGCWDETASHHEVVRKYSLDHCYLMYPVALVVFAAVAEQHRSMMQCCCLRLVLGVVALVVVDGLVIPQHLVVLVHR